MMKIDVLTLFPKMFNGFKSESIIKKAIDEKKVSIDLINFRDFSNDKHKKVDDIPYGGGSGMLLACQPIFDAIKSVKKEESKVVMLSPQGEKFNQKIAYDLSHEKHLIFVCGHYEGFDERIHKLVDLELSIGDYILTGGELPAMVVIDSVTRLIPGVIKEESHENESFADNLLDYPNYTKPREYDGEKVPDVLLSGNHSEIDKWRKEKQIEITIKKRPDLIMKNFSLKKESYRKRENEINVDDIKDIKVIESSKEEKESKKEVKKYLVIREPALYKVLNINTKYGYKLKNRSNNSEINNIVILDKYFIEKVAKKNLLRKLDTLIYRFNLVYESDDNDSSILVLGEAQRLRDMIIAQYSKYLGVAFKNIIINKIDIIIKALNEKKELLYEMFRNDYGDRRR